MMTVLQLLVCSPLCCFQIAHLLLSCWPSAFPATLKCNAQVSLRNENFWIAHHSRQQRTMTWTCLEKLRFQFIWSSAKFLLWIQWTQGHLVKFYHPLDSRLRLMLGWMKVFLLLASRDALLDFGHLLWSVIDLIVLLFFCGSLWRLFSEKLQCWMFLFDLLQYQHQPAHFLFRVLKAQIRCNSIHYFSAKFWFRIP